jgi:predicted nuclease of predicted toxin-antitoxin system
VRFMVDECFGQSVVRALQACGRDIAWVSDVCRSVTGPVVLSIANEAERILITEVRDFSQLAFLERVPAYGIVNFYANECDLQIDGSVDLLCDTIDRLGSSLVGTMTVIEPGRIRQRVPPEKPI